ncbi:DUF159 family protein (plasmid) [Achromobacter xylosoxidans]|uniref:SOS response-associated peptidase n=1 Tax=Alcaligenes xylosoxydans xylosoxydans TaxID=85698 RepID=UPI000DD150E8|nr:SOS response-associated peptidase family protein [Achromobacter xylosoxidans]AXA80577.1 DUF159 family protein [Achromobacter xylosoxidans]
MCSHYQAIKNAALLEKRFLAKAPADMGGYDLRPTVHGLFLRRSRTSTAGIQEIEAAVGRWGLISARGRPFDLKLATFNARAEDIAVKRTFRDAWHARQFCVIPAEAIFEPDWRQKYQIATRFTRADGHPLAIAGIWDRGINETGEQVDSYTMITINADDHPLFKHYHRREDEKRMVVMLADNAWQRWLGATVDEAKSMLLPIAADQLIATPMPVGNATNLSLF